jgi:hypothetical protein
LRFCADRSSIGKGRLWRREVLGIEGWASAWPCLNMRATIGITIGRWSAAAAAPSAFGTIRQILSDLVRDELAAIIDKNSPDAMPHELVVQHVVGAYMAVLTWWLDGGRSCRPSGLMQCFGVW